MIKVLFIIALIVITTCGVPDIQTILHNISYELENVQTTWNGVSTIYKRVYDCKIKGDDDFIECKLDTVLQDKDKEDKIQLLFVEVVFT
jgi:hypothetical protein